MTRLSRFFLYFILVVLAVWQLPWCYAFLTVKAAPQRFVMYSSLLGDFLLTGYEEGTGLTRHDTQGRSYTEQEVDSLLPMFYMRQLVADERFPRLTLRTAGQSRGSAADIVQFPYAAFSR